MATIQERAKNVMSDEFCSAMNMGRRDGYIIGATEQHKIDIYKACEWLEREYAYNGSMACITPDMIEDFRKAMEGKV